MNDPENPLDSRPVDDTDPLTAVRGIALSFFIMLAAWAVTALAIYAAPLIFHRQPVHVTQQGEQ